MRGALLCLLVGLALALAPLAAADTAPISDDGSLPWSNPQHEGQLELLAGTIASAIAGRPVSVHCHGATEWAELGGDALGFVMGYYNAADNTWAADATVAELAPGVCAGLNGFALANPKPTKCRAQKTVTETVLRPITVKTKVTVRVRGKLVTKIVTTKKRVPRIVEKQVTGPLAPCYLGNGRRAAGSTESYWQQYGEYAHSILTLAHESIHLQQLRAGFPVRPSEVDEREAECYGIQWMARVAQGLGAAADDAQALAAYFYDELSGAEDDADCRAGWALDLTPTDGIWP